MSLQHSYSIPVRQTLLIVLAHRLALHTESVYSNSNSFVNAGAVICKGFADTVQFGTITMTNYTFGSCYGEQDQFFPER